MGYYVDKNIDALYRIDNDLVRNGYLRLDMNENPVGLPEDFVDRIRERITPAFLSEYPNVHPFLETYSKHIGLPEECIRPTNGSDMGIRMIYEVFGRKGSKTVSVSPSFEMYRIYAEMFGMEHDLIRYHSDLSYPTEEMLDAINDDTSIVVLLNPNNPIGDLIPMDDIVRIVEKARDKGAIVVIDEAYHYFCDSTCIDLIGRYDNVIVLRTFSKIFSMAAARLGVVLSNKRIIDILFKAQPSFDVNSFALMIGKAVLEENVLEGLKKEFFEGKEFIEGWFSDNGYEIIRSNGNYMSFRPHTDVKSLSERFKERMVLVKTYSDPILSEYIRITIGNRETMERFTGILKELDR